MCKLQWDFQTNATRTSPPGLAFVLDVPLCTLRASMCDFVPYDRIVSRAYYGAPFGGPSGRRSSAVEVSKLKRGKKENF